MNLSYPSDYSFYITMGLLAALDSLLGAVKAYLKETYDNLIFLSGFLVNSLLAAALVYLGDRLGVPLYYAVIFVFGGRLFQNGAAIRRLLIGKYVAKKSREDVEK
ncbi:MAG: small basic family protein [Firmicutes bacterium]|nr:small basic family protein [Bacillota bacterium]